MSKRAAAKKATPKAEAAKAVGKKGRAPKAAVPPVAAGQAKFVIEGVPPLETGLSALGALHSALRVMGVDIPYDTLSVAGGEAMRLHVQTGRAISGNRKGDPAAGVCMAASYFGTENPLEAACEALGVRARVVCLESQPSASRLKAIWREIEESVRSGRPVPACGPQGSFQHEWCLITGIDDGRDRVFFRDATHRFELYGNGPRGSAWQGWMPGPAGEVWMPHVIVEGVAKRAANEERLAERAVARAVAAARAGFVRPHWASGLAAYHVWILQLGQERWHAESAERLREAGLANSWLLVNTFAGRRAAGQFFERMSRRFSGKKNAAMHRAARLYSASAGALQKAGALFPNWGEQYEEAERRAKAAELLAIAASAEREAVEGFEETFGEATGG